MRTIYVKRDGTWQVKVMVPKIVYVGTFEHGWAHVKPQYVPFASKTYPKDPMGPDEIAKVKPALWPEQGPAAVPLPPSRDGQGGECAARAGLRAESKEGQVMAGQLDGKVAIVTGAGRGFGKAIALRFAKEGAAVAVTARSKPQLDETVKEIEAAGGRAVAIAGDVTNRDDVAKVVAGAREAFGPIDILISNAGVSGPFGPLYAIDPDEWWDAQRVHVRGALLYCSAVLPEMVERKTGHIIVVSALAATVVGPNMSAYCVAKSSQNRLVEHIAAEVKPFNVAAFAIEPGMVVTDLAKGTKDNEGAKRWMPQMVERISTLEREVDPAPGLAKCAELCLRLASGHYDFDVRQIFRRPERSGRDVQGLPVGLIGSPAARGGSVLR